MTLRTHLAKAVIMAVCLSPAVLVISCKKSSNTDSYTNTNLPGFTYLSEAK